MIKFIPCSRGKAGQSCRRRRWRAVGVLWLLGPLACGGNGTTAPAPPKDPDVKDQANLTFLRQAPTAPPLLTTDTTMLATRGENFELQIFYAPKPGSGSEEGEEFLELKIDAESLLRYPVGHPRAGATFQPGDTVAIHVKVDPKELLVTLEPTGLQFDPDRPAELELRYINADDDFNGDGEPDPEEEGKIDLWRQERLGDPWVRIGQLKDAELDRVRASLTGFSRYALAI